MRAKKFVNILAYVLLITLVLIMNVYAKEVSGTYTSNLIDGNDPIDIYVDGTYIGEYTDFWVYVVDLERDQNIKLKLDVPNGADFDLFVFTEDETKGWSSTSDTAGADEELSIKVPEAGEYMFIVASWTGSGVFTLNWETPGALSDILIYILIVVVVVIVAIVVLILLLRRRNRVPPPPPPAYVQPSAPTPSISESPQTRCPHCNGALTWIEQYQRWYCYNCSKYI